MDFTGNNSGVVFITGAGSGIGQTTALQFRRSGCTQFALVDVATASLEKTKALLEDLDGGKGEARAESTSAGDGVRQEGSIRGNVNPLEVLLLPTDVSDEEQVVSAVRQAFERFGRIDYAVQSAGVNQRPRALLHEMEMKSYDSLLNINLRGLYMMQRELVKVMRTQSSSTSPLAASPRRGSIVNIASISGISPTPNLTPYAASKAGVIAITKGDSQSYAKEGIRINCICPGVVLTPMNVASQAAGQDFSSFTNATPVGRAGQPDEIAWAALFLSHPNSSYIVGHSLVVDGGTTLSM